MFCKQQVAQLRGVQDEFRKHGAELIVIGNGAPHFAEAFKKELEFDGPLYTDPSLKTYEAAEMKRTLGGVLDPRILIKGFGALSQGFMQGRTKGDPLQLGGVVVVDREGRVKYRQASEHAGDHPPVEDLVRAVVA